MNDYCPICDHLIEEEKPFSATCCVCNESEMIAHEKCIGPYHNRNPIVEEHPMCPECALQRPQRDCRACGQPQPTDWLFSECGHCTLSICQPCAVSGRTRCVYCKVEELSKMMSKASNAFQKI